MRPFIGPISRIRRNCASHGATLLELVVASGILAMGLIPLFQLAGGSMTRVDISRQELVARTLATEVMEQVRLVGFRSMPYDQKISVNLGPKRRGGQVFVDTNSRIPLILGSYPFDLKLSIFIEPDDPSEFLAKVHVSVTWSVSPQTRQSTGRVDFVELVENRVGSSPKR